MKKVGKNDPCPCGSGKKYKDCHPGEYDPDKVFARELQGMPVCGCWIADDYHELGMTPIIIAREHDKGNKIAMSVFLCDLFCLGIKDAFGEFHTSRGRLEEAIGKQPQTMIDVEYDEARDIILGAAKYAESLGFLPHPDYEKAKTIIEPDRPFQYQKENFGFDGKPRYINGPRDDIDTIIEKLEETVGKGNFDVIHIEN